MKYDFYDLLWRVLYGFADFFRVNRDNARAGVFWLKDKAYDFARCVREKWNDTRNKVANVIATKE